MIRKIDGKERGGITDKKRNEVKLQQGAKKGEKVTCGRKYSKDEKVNERNGDVDHRSGPQNRPSPPHPVTISEGIQNTVFCQNIGIQAKEIQNTL